MPGPIVTRMQQLTGFIVALCSGSEPVVSLVPEVNADDFENASEVYGDNVIELFPQISTPCDKSPFGQCEFGPLDPDHCRFCGRYV